MRAGSTDAIRRAGTSSQSHIAGAAPTQRLVGPRSTGTVRTAQLPLSVRSRNSRSRLFIVELSDELAQVGDVRGREFLPLREVRDQQRHTSTEEPIQQ